MLFKSNYLLCFLALSALPIGHSADAKPSIEDHDLLVKEFGVTPVLAPFLKQPVRNLYESIVNPGVDKNNRQYRYDPIMLGKFELTETGTTLTTSADNDFVTFPVRIDSAVARQNAQHVVQSTLGYEIPPSNVAVRKVTQLQLRIPPRLAEKVPGINLVKDQFSQIDLQSDEIVIKLELPLPKAENQGAPTIPLNKILEYIKIYGIDYTASSPVAKVAYNTVVLEISDQLLSKLELRLNGLGGHRLVNRSGTKDIVDSMLQEFNAVGIWHGPAEGVLKNYTDIMSLLRDRFFTEKNLRWEAIKTEEFKELFNTDDLTPDLLTKYISNSLVKDSEKKEYHFKESGSATVPIKGIPVKFSGAMNYDQIKQKYYELGIHVEEEGSIIVPKSINVYTLKNIDSKSELRARLTDIRVEAPHAGDVNFVGTIDLENSFNPKKFSDLKKSLAATTWQVHLQNSNKLTASVDATLSFDSNFKVVGGTTLLALVYNNVTKAANNHGLGFAQELEIEVGPDGSPAAYLSLHGAGIPINTGVSRFNVLAAESWSTVSKGEYGSGAPFSVDFSMTKVVKPTP